MPTVAPLDLSGHCIAALWLNDVPFFALADGGVHRLDNGHHNTQAHDGLLTATADPAGNRILTSGEDGKVVATEPDGTAQTLAERPRKWINAVAPGPNGSLAYAVGRSAFVRFADGREKEFTHPRTAEGLAFAPKGFRLAVARYNGATLHFPATDSRPTELEWAGAHTSVTFSPDGNFLVTAMQENALHGWRLADARHMKMTGYPAKVKSLSWSAKGRWLASSGANAAVVWPFQGKDGPMGKAPLELGTRGDSLATSVACHPVDEIVAIGFADGMIMAVRFADAREVLLRRPGKGAVSSLSWDKGGRRLAFGAETGDCGVVDIAG